MQQFAVASVYPRSIAWLIREGEWERLEVIIKYNCAMVGGYFNVIIPVEKDDTITDRYMHFLKDYDPDLIILATDMLIDKIKDLFSQLQPFEIVPWEAVSEIATIDPLGLKNGQNATTIDIWHQMIGGNKKFTNMLIATANDTQTDNSRLALIACGDIEPREPIFNFIDGEVDLDTDGYREHFLQALVTNQNEQLVKAHLNENGTFVHAPNRYQLADLLAKERKFPLEVGATILATCCKMQHYRSAYPSFIGMTIEYYPINDTPSRISTTTDYSPSLIILVSDSFKLKDAVLFWNLRANRIYVSWLSFSDLKNDTEAVIKWLDSDLGGVLYWGYTASDIAFSCESKDLPRLHAIFNEMQKKRKENLPQWRVMPHHELIFYNYVRPSILQENVQVIESGDYYTFLPKLPSGIDSGIHSIMLKWDGFMLPQNNSLINEVSQEVVQGFVRRKRTIYDLPQLRINRDHYLQIQISKRETKPIKFHRPSTEQIIQTSFVNAGFPRIERSSTAKYHSIFIKRAGDLDTTAHYLTTFPYRELFELLADNKNLGKPGWLIDNPSKRRVLNHLQFLQFLKHNIPTLTQEYFNSISDQLPEQVIDLLEQQLLERGFLLTCSTCSFKSWYPAEHVGQTFECARCAQIQVYSSNPLWLYKLPEVIFQGFKDNMQVPITTIHYLKQRSLHSFEWIPDSNVCLNTENKKLYRNIDILCISDGHLYIGEAKSNDEIDKKQFQFYEEICNKVKIDGIIFATSKPQWNRQTWQLIDKLKSWFSGETLVLTEKDLYLNK